MSFENEVDDTDDGQPRCGRCLKVVSGDMHTCPFKEEIHDDYATLCNCCDGCQRDCSQDI